MVRDIRTFFPPWYWRVFDAAIKGVLNAPGRLQKGLYGVFLTAWASPVHLRAKWLWRAHG